jgi:hypothetical protein
MTRMIAELQILLIDFCLPLNGKFLMLNHKGVSYKGLYPPGTRFCWRARNKACQIPTFLKKDGLFYVSCNKVFCLPVVNVQERNVASIELHCKPAQAFRRGAIPGKEEAVGTGADSQNSQSISFQD